MNETFLSKDFLKAGKGHGSYVVLSETDLKYKERQNVHNRGKNK